MKNKKLIATATFAALAVGGLSAGTIASAQSSSSTDATVQTIETPAADATDSVAVPGQGGALNIQDADGDSAEGEAPDGARHGHRGGGCDLDDAAEAIGIEESALREALDGGQSIAEVAEANGVEVQDVIDAMVTAKTEDLAEKVAEGRLTQDEADEKSADLETRITDQVNGAEDPPEA